MPPTSRDPRDSTSEALLVEIEPEPSAAATASPAPASENGSQPTTEGSFVHVEDETPVVEAAVVEEVAVVEVVLESELVSEDPPEPAL